MNKKIYFEFKIKFSFKHFYWDRLKYHLNRNRTCNFDYDGLRVVGTFKDICDELKFSSDDMDLRYIIDESIIKKLDLNNLISMRLKWLFFNNYILSSKFIFTDCEYSFMTDDEILTNYDIYDGYVKDVCNIFDDDEYEYLSKFLPNNTDMPDFSNFDKFSRFRTVCFK